MYESYYQLSERPFSITPNPRFVFLSRRHQDALAHLLYGVGTGGSGGFVQLTGEVGTGKTTLCRLVLEQVPEKTRIALILNPMLGPLELLEAICDELEIEHERGRGNGILKIHGALNRYLLEAHAAGERVVLIIDEAQNLSFDALEQIRLLTNLETATEKLLQIILIGQPELRQVLRKPQLRQLAQRITARYHLDPLEEEETQAYIRHRLTVAGAERCPFSVEAMREIYLASEGVPRLINIIADRALLAGYAQDQMIIGRALVQEAANEVAGEEARARSSALRGALAVAGVLVLMALGLGLAALMGNINKPNGDAPQPLWQQQVLSSSAVDGWQEAAMIWPGVDPATVQQACEDTQAIVRGNVACLALRGNWGLIKRLNIPVVLRLSAAPEAHVLLFEVSGQEAGLRHQGQDYRVPLIAIDRLWQGQFFAIWPDEGASYRPGQSDPLFVEFKRLASKMDTAPWRGDETAEFNSAFADWIQAFQTRNGLVDDGVIGPATRLFLGYPQHERQGISSGDSLSDSMGR